MLFGAMSEDIPVLQAILACISVLSALSCPNERTIVFENHKNIVNLGSTYYHPQSAGCVREPMYYQTTSGLEKVLQLVEKGKNFLKKIYMV